MKAFLYKAKGVVALTLAMAMFCPQVYAVESLSAAEQGVQEPPAVEVTADEILANAKKVLTVETALERAKKHSPDLKDLEDSLDLLKEQDEKIFDRVGSVKIPNYEYRKWDSDGWHAMVSNVFRMEQQMKNIKIGRELQELILEMTVTTYFQKIISLEDTVALLQQTADMQDTAFKQGQVKYRLGMLSKYNLDQLEITAKQAKDTLIMTEAGLNQLYITFNNLIGENANERFVFEYDLAFEPFEMTHTIDQYVLNAMKKDLVIQMQEIAVESAKFTANYRSESDSGNTYDSDKLSYDMEKRALKTAKAEKETLIRNTYLQIKSKETEYESALASLNKAQADYRVAQLSYQVGVATKTAVNAAAMAVTMAENAVKTIVYDHDMLIYKFENPSILSGAVS